jgi:hypothetical protein
MAGEAPRKAFGEYQGQKVSPIPEGFLQSYANVAKNISDLGTGIGKGLEGAILAYRQNKQDDDNLTEKLGQGAETANAVVQYKTQTAAELHSKALQGLSPDSTDIPMENRMALATAESMTRDAKIISDAYQKGFEGLNRDAKNKVLGLIYSGQVDMSSAAKTAAATAEANRKRLDSESTRYKNNAQGAQAEAATNKTTVGIQRTNAANTVREVIAKSSLASRAIEAGNSEENIRATILELTTARDKAIAQNKVNAEAGYPPVWGEQHEQAYAIQMSGLTAAAASVSKEEVDKWKAEHMPPVLSSVKAGKDLIAGFEQALKSLSPELQKQKDEFNALTGMPRAMDPQNYVIANDLQDKIDTVNLAIEKFDKDPSKSPIYLGSRFGQEGDAQIGEWAKRRAYAMSYGAWMASSQLKDMNGQPLTRPPTSQDLEALKVAVEYGALGHPDPEGRVWKFEDNGGLSYTIDPEIARIRAKPPKDRTVEEQARIGGTQQMSRAVKSELGIQTFGDSTVIANQTPLGTNKQLIVSKTEPLIHVAGEPQFNVHVAGQINAVDKNKVGEFRKYAATYDALVNEAQNVITNFLAKRDEATGLPMRYKPEDLLVKSGTVKAGELIPKDVLTDDEVLQVGLLNYKIAKQTAQGTGRLTDKHYQIVSGMLGTQLPIETLNLDEKAIKNAMTSWYRREEMTPAKMIGQMRSVQQSSVDALRDRIRTGSDVYASDDAGLRVGPLYMDAGMWNHRNNEQGPDGKPRAVGSPIVGDAFATERAIVNSKVPRKPTDDEAKTIKNAWNLMNQELRQRIYGTGDPNNFNPVGAAFHDWGVRMSKNKEPAKFDSPERTAFIDACMEQGATLEAVTFWIKYSENTSSK